jgi:hypothetical protein
MAHRILIVACLLLTAASLVLASLVWQQSNRAASAAAESNYRLTELFTQTQPVNQAKMAELLLRTESMHGETLKQLQAVVNAAQTSDWVPVSFKLAQETPDGSPVCGARLLLGKGLRAPASGTLSEGTLENSDKLIRRDSDSKGMVEFGALHPGDWDFALSLSCDDQSAWRCAGSINVSPGTKVIKTIVCPKTRSDRAAVQLRVEWPADLAEKEFGVLATFVRAPIVFQPSVQWRLTDSDGLDRFTKLLLGPRNYQSEIGEGIELELWSSSDGLDGSPGSNRVFADAHSLKALPRPETSDLELGSYALHQLIVVAPCGRESVAGGARFEVFAHANAPFEMPSSAVASCTTDSSIRKTVASRVLSPDFSIAVHKDPMVLSPAYWRGLDGRFVVHPKQANEWKIPLPDVLIAFLREKLRAESNTHADGVSSGPRTEVSISP